MAPAIRFSARDRMRPRLVGAALVALGFLIAMVITPAQTLQLGRAVMQPATLPAACGFAIALCGLVILLWPTPDSGSPFLVPTTGAVALALISFFGMSELGFPIMAPALVLLLMLGMGERRWLWLGVGSVLVPLGIWLCFGLLLGRQLP